MQQSTSAHQEIHLKTLHVKRTEKHTAKAQHINAAAYKPKGGQVILRLAKKKTPSLTKN